MGKAIMMLVVLSGIVFSFSNINTTVTNKSSVDNACSNFENNIARNIAKSGIDLCITKLDSNRNWNTGFTNLAMSNGTLSASVSTIDLEHVRIATTGQYTDKVVNIWCIVRIPGSELPEAFNYALASDGALTANGTVDIVMENPSLHANANIHSNSSIYVGTQVRVQGFATSAGTITCNPISKLPDVFVPNYNPNNDPKYVQNTSSIPIPDFNADQYRSIADEVHDGDYTFSGHLTIGTLTQPKIIWVGGNLTFDGNADLTGSVIFVVKREITINGNVTINNGVGSVSNIAFYSQSAITINGNASVEGQFYAKDHFTANGNATITGNVVVKNSDLSVTTLNGSALIKYRPGNPTLTSPIFTNNPRPQICSYWE